MDAGARSSSPHPPTGRRLHHQRVPLSLPLSAGVPEDAHAFRTQPSILMTSILTVTTSAFSALLCAHYRTLCLCLGRLDILSSRRIEAASRSKTRVLRTSPSSSTLGATLLTTH